MNFTLKFVFLMFKKKAPTEVFAMARLGKDVWKLFYEMGKLKEQKVSYGDIFRGTLSLKQWHMKPLCSLTDDNRLWLLVKVRCTVHSLITVGLSYYSLNSEG